MAKPQVAIVLPTTWSDGLVGKGEPIWPDELCDALDLIEDAHPEFEIFGMFKGLFDEQSSRIKLRLLIAESGDVLPLTGVESPGPGRPIGEDVDRVGQSGLCATIQRAMTAYSRNNHQTL